MNRLAAAALLLLVTGGIALANLFSEESVNPPATQLNRFSYTQLQMAMPMHLTVWCESEEAAQTSCKLAFARASELVKIFSDYDPDSEVNQLLNSETGVPHSVSHELFDVLSFSQRLYRDTNGAFDPSCGRLSQLWREARKTGTLPDESLLRSARGKAGFDNLVLNPQGRTVTLLSKELRLDFGGVAKGYIGDQVIQLLRQRKIQSAKYRAGGDIVLGASPPNSSGWKVRVAGNDGMPQERRLSHCGVSMSGDHHQYIEVDGVRYSHVVDPRSGEGDTSERWTVVVAATGMQSDAIATAGCIISEEELQHLIKLYDGASAWSSFRTHED